ncbi:MAG TPA: S-methyl-5-thioribose-1-phosphate isomerase [Bacteroidales bacterium]|nr:S-methyl-5-thioribose-1-phosphate isomerase [Bacteroidales bacterium]
MRAGGKHYNSIWLDDEDDRVVKVIDQQKLPFSFEIKELRSVEDVYTAIEDMTVRGAPLIGAAAAFGMYLSTFDLTAQTNLKDHLSNAARYLVSARPTAVNLSWAVNHVLERLKNETSAENAIETAKKAALEICTLETVNCRHIGEHGVKIIEEISRRKNGGVVNILTHCNAGWLACIDYGTVTAPIYMAAEKGIPVHIWVDETRPRNQGSKLTAWELGENNIPYTLIADNTGGHLMQHGMIDVVMVGCDRATRTGDVANKIGTYLKALAAFDNKIPFYAVLPSTSIDFNISNGIKEIAVEQRNPEEVTTVTGLSGTGITTVRICPENARAANYGFDVTPARLITGLITEKGTCRAEENEIRKLFSEKY